MVGISRFIPGILVLLGATLGACTDGNLSVPTGTRITPEFFRYATVIDPPTDGSTGGWRAVCIKAYVSQSIVPSQATHWDSGTQCALEFGSPIVNYQHGYIPLHMAQRISAEVANEVAYSALTGERGITATTCTKLRVGMNVLFGKRIRGSAVNQCGTTQWSESVPEVIWPPPH